MVNIPKTQRAAVLTRANEAFQVKTDHPVVQPEDLKSDECLVQIEYTGLCRTDLAVQREGLSAGANFPIVCGHEGVGRVVAIGKGSENICPVKIGERVGVKWLAYSCLNCEMCRRGCEGQCDHLKFGGYHVDGSFQQYVRSYIYHVTPIPDNILSEAACPILCAGVTVWKAIRDAETRVGDWAVIPGAGGGLGHLAVQYCVAKGLCVVAVDDASKKDACLKWGAVKFIDFQSSGKDLVKHIIEATDGRGAHLAVVIPASAQAYTQACEYVRPFGYVMAIGLIPNDTAELPVNRLILGANRFIGSLTGNRQDAIEALELAAAGKVSATYEVRPMSEINQILEDMEAGKIVGRVVMDVSK